MGRYEVDPAELQQCDAQLDAAAGQARAALAQLRASARDVLGGWQGEAGAAFRLAWEQWLAGVGTMLDSLDETALALGLSGADYAATDDAVRGSLAGATR